jgi:hypothetical protein
VDAGDDTASGGGKDVPVTRELRYAGRTVRVFLFLIALLAAAPAFAQSGRFVTVPQSAPAPAPPPPLEQAQKPQPNQESPSTPDRGTEQAPLIVKTVPEAQTPDQIVADEEKAELDRKTVKLTSDLVDYTWLLFIATGALGIITFCLAIAAFFQIRESRNATKVAENLAATSQRNVDLIPEIERAYVSGGGARQLTRRISKNALSSFNEVPVEQPDGSFAIVGPTNRFEIHINNHGKTPAHLYRIQYGFCDADNVPIEPMYEVTRKWFDNIGPGTQSRFVTVVEIRSDWPRTAIFGRFYHRDIWGVRRSVGFIYGIPETTLPNDSISIEAPRAYTQERDERDDRGGQSGNTVNFVTPATE